MDTVMPVNHEYQSHQRLHLEQEITLICSRKGFVRVFNKQNCPLHNKTKTRLVSPSSGYSAAFAIFE